MTLRFLTVGGMVMVSFSEKSEEREFMERRASIWFCRLSLLCVSDIEWRCQPNSWYGSLELSGTTAQGELFWDSSAECSRMQHLSSVASAGRGWSAGNARTDGCPELSPGTSQV